MSGTVGWGWGTGEGCVGLWGGVCRTMGRGVWDSGKGCV